MSRTPGHHGPVASSGTIDELWVDVAPMLASGPPEPLRAPVGPQWSFEVKWDGVRALALVRRDGSVALRSRKGVDLARHYPAVAAPEVGAAVAPYGAPAILDGECVAVDPEGKPSFTGAIRGGAAVRFVVFDVLVWAGRDVRGETLSRRRALLATADLPTVTGGVWLPSAVFDDGDALLAATREQGLEGVMAKRSDSSYECGVRSRAWVKLPHRTLTEVVVVGWVRAESGGGVSSLAVADARGEFLGTVGSGMTNRMSAALLGVFGSISRSQPVAEVHVSADAQRFLGRLNDRLTWLEPLLVAEVRHLGRTESGALRQPTLARMRPDLGPADLPGSTW
jgi:bifunctional non-homologous end joining protein LigD